MKEFLSEADLDLLTASGRNFLPLRTKSLYRILFSIGDFNISENPKKPQEQR